MIFHPSAAQARKQKRQSFALNWRFKTQGAESQNRTVDTAIFSRVLYQLS